MRRHTWVFALAALCLAGPALGQSITGNWDAVTLDVNGDPESISGYHIHYGIEQGGPYPDGFSTGNVLTTQVDGLTNGETYYFVVTAIDQAGNRSADSNEQSYTVPFEDCNNLQDDDHDASTDCQDDECPANNEECDGFDNDCDGQADNGLTGEACPLQNGVCQGSTMTCGGAAGWLPCDASAYGGDYEPNESSCDGLDNDCDDQTDENLTPQDCPLQLGVCLGATQTCQGASGWSACDASAYGADYEQDETSCDSLDNDCDGSIDEDCTCDPGDTQACSTDEGECVAGTQTCDAGASWGACSGVLPGTETCDGLDNDCDAQTDEDLTGAACTLQDGVCAGATQTCGGASGWLACDASAYGASYEVEETTCDGLDNDCDTEIDEGDICGGDPGVDAGQDGGTQPDGGTTPSDLDEIVIQGSCGCAADGPAGALGLALLPALVWLRRRRR